MQPRFPSDPDRPLLFETETFRPEECGWMRVGERTWETPSGEMYVFSPGKPELIARFKEPCR